MPCDPLNNALDFLEVEKSEVFERQSRRRVFKVFISESFKDEDLWYSFTTANKLKIEEGSWVEINSDFKAYGSLWFSDKRNRFYLITDVPIPARTHVKIREADEVQLVLMQEQALKFLLESQTERCRMLRNIICGNYVPKQEKIEYVSFFNINLTENQKKAIVSSLSIYNENPFFLIHGPPGTGKTTVIAELVRQFRSRGMNVLITSHTNVAVDNAMERLLPDYNSSELGSKIVRLGLRAKVTDKRLRDLVPVKNEELVKLKTAQVVGATLSKVSMLKMCNKVSWENPFFDVVIVDESSMATIPLTLVGVLSGKQFILVGDHKQLPPIVTERAGKVLKEKYESLFRLLYEKYPAKSVMLDVQYRSHPEIMEFSSNYFYNGKIKSALECSHKVLALSKIPYPETVPRTLTGEPVICINTEDVFDEPVGWVEGSLGRRRSYFNQYEAAVALAIMDELLRCGVPSNQICIITPYRLQSRVIRRAIEKKYNKDDVGEVYSLDRLSASTVDSFQGKESDVVIYCITWAPMYDGQSMHVALKNWRRLNVALTRARKKLIIIGNITSLYEYPFSALSEFLAKKNRIVKCPEINKFTSFLDLVMKCYENIKVKEEEKRKKEIEKEQTAPFLTHESAIASKVDLTKTLKSTLPENLPRLITFSDFEEYGKVYRYLKEHSNASDGEIAKNLRMPIDRVRDLRALINYETELSQKSINESQKSIEEGKTQISSEKMQIQHRENAEKCYTLEPNETSVSPTATNNNEKKGYCRLCGKKVTLDEIETYDGLCTQCWLRDLQKECAKEWRRSGLYGADRAGTW
ncbi:MAG: AAA domain-containing protein [Candidatus Bathyarchaeales archaeon]